MTAFLYAGPTAWFDGILTADGDSAPSTIK